MWPSRPIPRWVRWWNINPSLRKRNSVFSSQAASATLTCGAISSACPRGGSGATAYVSRTKLDSNLWRGAGGVHRTHWEAQVKADLGGDSWARFKFVSNDFLGNDSPTLTRAQYYSATPGFAPSVPGVA
jgi:hypothetical protein